MFILGPLRSELSFDIVHYASLFVRKQESIISASALPMQILLRVLARQLALLAPLTENLNFQEGGNLEGTGLQHTTTAAVARANPGATAAIPLSAGGPDHLNLSSH